jgi:hypothetical protein
LLFVKKGYYEIHIHEIFGSVNTKRRNYRFDARLFSVEKRDAVKYMRYGVAWARGLRTRFLGVKLSGRRSWAGGPEQIVQAGHFFYLSLPLGVNYANVKLNA